ncbi:MAG TPA: hypothetical protein VK548_08900 [Candidatus Acidoferrum sp.]|nr:hypothetical protein [Candidatus Acidoferrum sp.]
MRYRLGLMLAVAVIALCVLGGVGLAEATNCRVGGEYRFVGPSVVGNLKFTETGSDAIFSRGTVAVVLASKQFCPTCGQPDTYLVGDYWAGPGDQTCGVSFIVHDHADSAAGGGGYLSGTLAFAGAVIIFNGYDSSLLRPGVDINLTFAIRTDSFFRP